MDLISAHTAGGERRLPPLLSSGCPVENKNGIVASSWMRLCRFFMPILRAALVKAVLFT